MNLRGCGRSTVSLNCNNNYVLVASEISQLVIRSRCRETLWMKIEGRDEKLEKLPTKARFALGALSVSGQNNRT